MLWKVTIGVWIFRLKITMLPELSGVGI